MQRLAELSTKIKEEPVKIGTKKNLIEIFSSKGEDPRGEPRGGSRKGYE